MHKKIFHKLFALCNLFTNALCKIFKIPLCIIVKIALSKMFKKCSMWICVGEMLVWNVLYTNLKGEHGAPELRVSIKFKANQSYWLNVFLFWLKHVFVIFHWSKLHDTVLFACGYLFVLQCFVLYIPKWGWDKSF